MVHAYITCALSSVDSGFKWSGTSRDAAAPPRKVGLGNSARPTALFLAG
jgi:hypothetical protein